MNSEPKANANPDIEKLTADFAGMKRDIAALMSHLKVDAADQIDGLSAAAGDQLHRLGAGTRRMVDAVEAQGARSAKAIGHQVEDNPLMSLLIAFAVGMAASRLATR